MDLHEGEAQALKWVKFSSKLNGGRAEWVNVIAKISFNNLFPTELCSISFDL